MDELMKKSEGTGIADSAALGGMIREILSPVLASMAEFMAHNTEALEKLATQQKIQSDRMEALEKQIRLNTLLTPTQVRYIGDAVKTRAREILSKKQLEDDRKAVNALAAAIRKAILHRYGVAALHEIPKHEYSVVMQQISTWNDAITMMDITKAARRRNAADTDDRKNTGLLEE